MQGPRSKRAGAWSGVGVGVGVGETTCRGHAASARVRQRGEVLVRCCGATLSPHTLPPTRPPHPPTTTRAHARRRPLCARAARQDSHGPQHCAHPAAGATQHGKRLGSPDLVCPDPKPQQLSSLAHPPPLTPHAGGDAGDAAVAHPPRRVVARAGHACAPAAGRPQGQGPGGGRRRQGQRHARQPGGRQVRGRGGVCVRVWGADARGCPGAPARQERRVPCWASPQHHSASALHPSLAAKLATLTRRR